MKQLVQKCTTCTRLKDLIKNISFNYITFTDVIIGLDTANKLYFLVNQMRSNENRLGNKYDKFEDEDKVVNEIFEDTIDFFRRYYV